MSLPIVTKGLSKVYAEGSVEVTAVAGVDLEFREGEIVGLFGPSGSGKTTLLSILGCILRPTAGSISIYGQETSSMGEHDLPAVRRQYISFIFQGFNLFPALTARENVLLALKLKGITGEAADERADFFLGEVGLGHRLDFLPRDLSGGQKQRVAVARALASDAPIILADEPTGNLDQENGRNVMEIIRKLATDRRKCVVVATHDNRIEEVFDRTLIMEDGRIVTQRFKES